MSYLTGNRKDRAVADLKIIHACAEEAGISHALFIGFGLALGIVREGDFIASDNDVDMCVLADLITPQQELVYYHLLDKNGMFFARKRWSLRPWAGGFKEGAMHGAQIKGVPSRFTWFSLRKRKNHCKFCHWFGFTWNNYWWHTKAGKWINPRKFDPVQWKYDMDDDAVMLGCPAHIVEKLRTENFHGLKIQIPGKIGTYLDWCYPDWLTPKGGSSHKRVVCVVKRWSDQSTWHVKVGNK